jgi:phosphoribosylglycinamide formyltransferase-1
MKDQCSIAIFASGNGSNAEAIINFLQGDSNIRIDAIYSNNKDAYVLERAKNHQISSFVFDRKSFYSEEYQQLLVAKEYDLIVLAGFMWLIPESLVTGYPNKIINIHPALLPNYGGKGMYGHHVHEAVLANRESHSGITIHYVNERYDEGNVILQESCAVMSEDTVDSLANRIHELEHLHYPQVVKKICLKLLGEG